MQIIDTARAWITAHPYVSAWLGAIAISVLAWAMQLPKVQAWLVRYPLAKLVADVLSKRIFAFVAALGGDIPKAIAAAVVGQPATAQKPAAETSKGPPTIPPVLGALLLAISLAGCGHLPPVARIVVDAGCVATHYDELADAEQAGAGAFLVAVERVARKCGIERDVLVTIFGTHKQGRARAAMQPPAPACSSATLATPVRP